MQRVKWLHAVLLVVMLSVGLFQPAAVTVQASSGANPQIFDTTGTSTKFVDVVTGDNHTCALRANGTVMCWGYNGEGQLGINDGSIRQSLYPVEVPGVNNAVAIAGAANNTCVITREATLTCWGQGYFGDGNGVYSRWYPSTVAGLRDINKIAMSNRGTCVTNIYGMMLCWGEHMQYYAEWWLPYANPGEPTYYFPKQVATGDYVQIAVRNVDRNKRYCMLKTDGRLTCNGVNMEGHLGLGYTSQYNHAQYTVNGLGTFTRKFAISGNGGCAILTDATVSCWGTFAGGYDSVARYVAMPEPMVDVYGSTYNRYWFKGQSGKIYAVGDNPNGALGVNSSVNPWNVITEIPELFGATRVAGTDEKHGCAVLPSGRIKCWGSNPYGALGNGTTNGSYAPVNLALPGEPLIGSATTDEDTLSGVIRIRRHPEDGPETSHVRITRVVNGRLFRPDGVTPIATGSYLTMAEAESGVRFLPDTNINGVNAGAIAIQASTKPNITGVSTTVVTGTVSINPVADAPVITDAETHEDMQSYDGLVIQRNPADGPEVTHALITNVVGGQLYAPNGTTPIAVGTIIDLTTGAQGLRFTPDANRVDPGSVEVRAATSAAGAGLSASATARVTIYAVVDGAPTISGTTVREDEISRPDIVIARNAQDGAEIRYFRVVSSAPGRFYLNDGTTPVPNGSFVTATAAAAGLRFRPNPNIFGSYTVQAQAALAPTVEGIGGEIATAPIVITAVADVPRITGASVAEGEMSTTGLVVLPNAADGAEVTHFRIANVVGGTLFLADGMTSVAIGQFITVAQGAAGLRFSAPLAAMNNGMVEVQAATAPVLTAVTTTRATALITIADRTAPDIELPYDMILNAYTDVGTRVDFAVSANDLRDGAVAVTCNYSSGVYLPVGTHTITCSATDRAGNTAHASFVVVVQKIAPTVQLSPIDAISGQNVPLRWALNVETGLTYRFDVQRRALPSGEWMFVAQNVTDRSATIRSVGEVGYAFRVRATLADGTTGAWSNVVNTVIDETAPTVNAWLNRGIWTGVSAEAATANKVRLTLQNSDADPATLVRWSEDGITYSSWIPYRSINDVFLSAGDGYKELRIEARDRVGNISTTYAGIIVNTTAADAYGIVLNNGDSFTSSNAVNLTISTPRSVYPPIAEMQFSENGVFDPAAPWQVFALGGSYTFNPATSSLYRLHVRFRSVDGTVLQVVSDDIMIDSAAPSTTLSIKSVSAKSVQVGMTATDRATSARATGSGVAQMQVAAAGNFGSAAWVPFSTTVSVAYDKSDKSAGGIYARFRDRAGNISATRCITPTGATCTVNPATVSNQAPVLTVGAPFRVSAGSVTVLSDRTLSASDAETPSSQLVYTLVSEPVNGWMLYGGARMTSGTRFTAADLARKRLVYRQNGTANEHDRIVVQVSDAQGAVTSATVWFLLDGVADPVIPTVVASATPVPTSTAIPTATKPAATPTKKANSRP